MIDKSLFAHAYEEEAFLSVHSVPFEKEIAHNYNEFTYPSILPDLYGKTVKVSAVQFYEIYQMAEELASLLEMPVPDIYVYESFYYTVESKGLNENWIEISAKTVIELSKNEIVFLLAKEMCAIKFKHTYYYTLINEAVSALSNGMPLVGNVPDVFQKIGKVKLYKWMRISHYSSDNFAYLASAQLNECISAIIKSVLNNTFIARRVNVMEFIKQAERINALNGKSHKLSKSDEQVPYAPYRVKSLMAYASSSRGIKALKELESQKGRYLA